MLQEAFRSNIESKLNNNTLNKEFRVGQFVRLDDQSDLFVYDIRGGYELISTDFIPVMMTMTSTYQAIPKQINGLATISLQFLVQANDKAQTDLTISSMDEIVSKVVGNFESIVDGTTTYKTVWNMDALFPTGSLELINGVYYTPITTTIYIDFSDTNSYGNEYEYYINETQIVPYSVNIQRSNEEDLPHILGETEAKGGMKTSQWTATVTVYIDDFISEIIDEFSTPEYDMDTDYKFSEVTPTRSTPLDITARIQSAVYNPELGVKTFATITFVKSDGTYIEPTYTITYTLNGGTNNASNPATFIYDDMPITLLNATRTGYAFAGWFTNINLTNQITQITQVGNITLYAKWTPTNVWIQSLGGETYWNAQNALGNAGTSAAVGVNLSPTEDPTPYATGFAMRVSNGAIPAEYYYFVKNTEL